MAAAIDVEPLFWGGGVDIHGSFACKWHVSDVNSEFFQVSGEVFTVHGEDLHFNDIIGEGMYPLKKIRCAGLVENRGNGVFYTNVRLRPDRVLRTWQ